MTQFRDCHVAMLLAMTDDVVAGLPRLAIDSGLPRRYAPRNDR
ncbi:MAG: hypothetical protein P1P85_04515 [Patescibacteria group bacterium]|nr:hypothetical protein [Patescibacteria group bacterium]